MSSKRDSQGRPPKPTRKRHLSGIKPVYSSGSWKWRAVAKLGGRQIVGTLRRTQQQAHADYLQLKEDLEVERVSGGAESYLGGAIDSFFANGTRDLSPITAQSLRAVSRQLLRAWDARLHLSTLRAEHIQAYADKSIGEGRHVNSVRKDLSLLRVLFKRAQIDWPGSPKLPRTPKPETHFFEPNELVEVVERIQNWRPASKIGRPASPAIQMRDSAIVAVLGFTGIRFYEFVRMTRAAGGQSGGRTPRPRLSTARRAPASRAPSARPRLCAPRPPPPRAGRSPSSTSRQRNLI